MKRIILIGLLSVICVSSFSQVRILMEKEGGVYKVPCKVNGVTLNFIFDTGASEVSLSLTEALFMLKNGYLEEKDFLGVSYAQIASGDIVENTKVILKEIEIGGLKLYNVNASISHTLGAPLLLGQSAIQQLGTIQLSGNELIILQGESRHITNNSTSPEYVNSNCPNNITDYEGNEYGVVEINNKCWMRHNLRVKHFSNGLALQLGNSRLSSTEEYYYFPEGQSSLASYPYGFLYNWSAVKNTNGLCPKGWHVPSKEEWQNLFAYFSMQYSICTSNGKRFFVQSLVDPSYWPSVNCDCCPAQKNYKILSGFDAIPSGYAGENGKYFGFNQDAYFWSSTSDGVDKAYFVSIYYTEPEVLHNYNYIKYGMSVRCVKN